MGANNRRGLAVTAILVALAAGGPVVVGLTSGKVADWMAATMAAAILRFFDSGPDEAPQANAEADVAETADGPGEAVLEELVESDAPTPSDITRKPSKVIPSKLVRGIRVRAALVQRLARRGVRPVGVPVPARGNRPAGLALSGVSALGVGAKDGDILTHVGGQPATSMDTVVGAVIGALRAHSPAIGGRIWRDGEVWQVVVEIPYPKAETTK